MPTYGTSIKVNLPYDMTVAKTCAALKEEGFGVITEIDVRKTVREKLDEEIAPYVILGACLPAMAHRAITIEPEIGLLMPCNVCVWDNGDGTSTVAAVDVKTLFQMVQHPELAQTAQVISAKLHAVIDSVASATLGDTAEKAAA